MDTNGHADAPDSLEVAAGDYVVELHPPELPADAATIVRMLMSENVQLHTWIDVAKSYLADGRQEQYEHVLRCADLPVLAHSEILTFT
jgi:hypothetical protein